MAWRYTNWRSRWIFAWTRKRTQLRMDLLLSFMCMIDSSLNGDYTLQNYFKNNAHASIWRVRFHLHPPYSKSCFLMHTPFGNRSYLLSFIMNCAITSQGAHGIYAATTSVYQGVISNDRMPDLDLHLNVSSVPEHECFLS